MKCVSHHSFDYQLEAKILCAFPTTLVNLKFSLCSVKEYYIKAYWALKVWLHAFLILVWDSGEWSASLLGKRSLWCRHWTEDRVPLAGLEAVRDTKTSVLKGREARFPGIAARSAVWHWDVYATCPAHLTCLDWWRVQHTKVRHYAVFWSPLSLDTFLGPIFRFITLLTNSISQRCSRVWKPR